MIDNVLLRWSVLAMDSGEDSWITNNGFKIAGISDGKDHIPKNLPETIVRKSITTGIKCEKTGMYLKSICWYYSKGFTKFRINF